MDPLSLVLGGDSFRQQTGGRNSALALPEAKSSWIRGVTRSSAAVSFYSRSCTADRLPAGPWPLFVGEETTAVAFTGFSYPGSSGGGLEKERQIC